MWERFTEAATRVVEGARSEACRVGSDYARTEHLLAQICREDCLAARVLQNLGVGLAA